MKIQLNDSGVVPPGGWHYTELKTGHKMRALSLNDLKLQIKTHREANGLDLRDGWWDQCQLEMCSDPVMGTHCREVGTDNKPLTKLKLVHLLQFFRTIRESVFRDGGFTKVDKEEAQRRANICETCPMNVDVKGCTGCQGVVRWLGEFLSKEDEVKQESKLKNCGACGCVLSLKIHLPLDVIKKAETKNLPPYPDHCWQNEAPDSPTTD